MTHHLVTRPIAVAVNIWKWGCYDTITHIARPGHMILMQATNVYLASNTHTSSFRKSHRDLTSPYSGLHRQSHTYSHNRKMTQAHVDNGTYVRTYIACALDKK